MKYVLPKPGDAHAWYHGAVDVAPRGVTWVLGATSQELEDDHEWVQWAFPTDTPSAYNAFAPVLTPREVLDIEGDTDLRGLHALLTHKALVMLEDNKEWPGAHRDHAHKRISRMIRSLTLLGHGGLAGEVMDYAKERTVGDLEVVSRVWVYWHNAAHRD